MASTVEPDPALSVAALASDVSPRTVVHTAYTVEHDDAGSVANGAAGGNDGCSPSLDVPLLSEAEDPRERTYVRAMLWCCGLMFVLYLGQMIILMAVFPDQLITFYNNGNSCEGTAGQSSDCKHATSHATLVSAIVASTGCFVTFIGSPLLGTAADTFGRRPALLFCAALNVIQAATLLLWVWGLTSINLYFAATVLAAFDSTSVILAYLSDEVPPAKRALCFGYLFAVIALTVIIGPFVGAAVPAKVAFILYASFVALFFILCCIIPESLPPALRTPFSTRDLNPFRAMGVLNRYTMFRRLAMVVFVSELVMRGKFAINFPFLKTRFGITEQGYAYVALAFGIMSTFSQSVLLKAMVKRWSNARILQISLLAVVLNMACYCFMWLEWQVYLVEVFSCLGFLAFPVVSAMKSNNVDSKEQGRIQGALYGVKQFGGGLGPVTFGAIFGMVSSDDDKYYNPELIWYVATALAVLALAIGMGVPALISADEAQAHEEAKVVAEKQAAEMEAAKAIATQDATGIVNAQPGSVYPQLNASNEDSASQALLTSQAEQSWYSSASRQADARINSSA